MRAPTHAGRQIVSLEGAAHTRGATSSVFCSGAHPREAAIAAVTHVNVHPREGLLVSPVWVPYRVPAQVCRPTRYTTWGGTFCPPCGRSPVYGGTFCCHFWHPFAQGFRLLPVWVLSPCGAAHSVARVGAHPRGVANSVVRVGALSCGVAHSLAIVGAHPLEAPIICVGSLPRGAAHSVLPCRRSPALFGVCSAFRTKLIKMPTFSEKGAFIRHCTFFKAPF